MPRPCAHCCRRTLPETSTYRHPSLCRRIPKVRQVAPHRARPHRIPHTKEGRTHHEQGKGRTRIFRWLGYLGLHQVAAGGEGPRCHLRARQRGAGAPWARVQEAEGARSRRHRLPCARAQRRVRRRVPHQGDRGELHVREQIPAAFGALPAAARFKARRHRAPVRCQVRCAWLHGQG